MASPSRAWTVTGGAGFLGRALVERLVGDGHAVTVLDTAPCPAVLSDRDEVRFVQGSVTDAAAVRTVFEAADHVVHAAAALPILRSRPAIFDVNDRGMALVLEEAARRGVASVVFTSTTAVYGLHREHPIHEGSPKRPVGPYGASKVAAERRCEAARKDGMHVTVLRPKTFLGRGRLGVFEILFDWIHDGKRVPLIGQGHNRYQLLHVGDLVDAILVAATRPEGNDTFNVGARRFGTLREDLTPLFEAAGHPPRFLPLPRRTTTAGLFVLDKMRLSPLTRWHYGTMAMDSYVETDKIATSLGFEPRFSNRETLLDAYEWYHAHRDEVKGSVGTGHTVAWKQGVLGAFKRFA